MFFTRPSLEVLEAVQSLDNGGTFEIFAQWVKDAQEQAMTVLKTVHDDIHLRRAQGALGVLDPLVTVLTEYEDLLESYNSANDEADVLAEQQI